MQVTVDLYLENYSLEEYCEIHAIVTFEAGALEV